MGYEPIGRMRPVAPAPSLLTSARPLPPVNWSTGIEWATSCTDTFVQRYCPGEARTAPGTRDLVHSMPFVIYTPLNCEFPIGDTVDLEQLVTDATEVHTPAAIADALWMGGDAYDPADTAQPTLRNAGIDVTPAAPLDLDDGVASLLAHYQLCTGGNGGAVIHMPGALATGALGGVSGGARVCWPEGSVYRTAHGAVVVPGPGYPEGSSPDGANGHGPLIGVGVYAGNASDTSWIYVTGPIEFAVSDVRVRPESERDRTTFRQNLYEVWGERDAIVRFDPCCVFAVEVNNLVSLPEVS